MAIPGQQLIDFAKMYILPDDSVFIRDGYLEICQQDGSLLQIGRVFQGLYVGGPDEPSHRRTRHYRSESDKYKVHAVSLFSDGSIFCTCSGFQYRRTCKHANWIRMDKPGLSPAEACKVFEGKA